MQTFSQLTIIGCNFEGDFFDFIVREVNKSKEVDNDISYTIFTVLSKSSNNSISVNMVFKYHLSIT